MSNTYSTYPNQNIELNFYFILPTINYWLLLGGAVGEQLENNEKSVVAQ